MDPPEGAGSGGCNRVDFDHRVGLEFRGTQISSDGGLPVIRELDDVPGLSGLASVAFLWRCATAAGARPPFTGSTGCFGGWSMDVLAGCGDVNDADRPVLDPCHASGPWAHARSRRKRPPSSRMGRFGTGTSALPGNRAALADLNGAWIDRFHDRMR